MSTLVAFHAHPDDESLAMGGTLARASAEGHRVVVVVATNGDHGEKPEGIERGVFFHGLPDRQDARLFEIAEDISLAGFAAVPAARHKGDQMHTDACSLRPAPSGVQG